MIFWRWNEISYKKDRIESRKIESQKGRIRRAEWLIVRNYKILKKWTNYLKVEWPIDQRKWLKFDRIGDTEPNYKSPNDGTSVDRYEVVKKGLAKANQVLKGSNNSLSGRTIVRKAKMFNNWTNNKRPNDGTYFWYIWSTVKWSNTKMMKKIDFTVIVKCLKRVEYIGRITESFFDIWLIKLTRTENKNDEKINNFDGDRNMSETRKFKYTVVLAELNNVQI